jgi:hypothetical protein
VVKLTPREEIACRSRGSSFRLETEATTGWVRRGERLGEFELLDTSIGLTVTVAFYYAAQRFTKRHDDGIVGNP